MAKDEIDPEDMDELEIEGEDELDILDDDLDGDDPLLSDDDDAIDEDDDDDVDDSLLSKQIQHSSFSGILRQLSTEVKSIFKLFFINITKDNLMSFINFIKYFFIFFIEELLTIIIIVFILKFVVKYLLYWQKILLNFYEIYVFCCGIFNIK